jgi:hypothetical protein
MDAVDKTLEASDLYQLIENEVKGAIKVLLKCAEYFLYLL